MSLAFELINLKYSDCGSYVIFTRMLCSVAIFDGAVLIITR